MNLYGFAGGDPVNFSDPYGLCPPCQDQSAAEGQEVVKKARAEVVEIKDNGITYGQERGNPKKRDCSEFVCRAVGDPHSGSTHLNSRSFKGNPNFRALGAGESPQAGDVLWQPRDDGPPGSGHVGIYTGETANGHLVGCEMGNSGANCRSEWGAGAKWFPHGDQLVILQPQVEKKP